MALVPDEPAEIRIQLARQDFLVEKAILKIPDETLGGGGDDGDKSDLVGQEYDIHTYHKDEGSVRATYRSNYRLSEAWFFVGLCLWSICSSDYYIISVSSEFLYF